MASESPCNTCKHRVPLGCNQHVQCISKAVKQVMDCLERGIFPKDFDPELIAECDHHEDAK